MRFNDHSESAGLHSFLAPSSPAWLNYDEEKLLRVYKNRLAALEGSELHDLAAKLIKHRKRMPETESTFNRYVNDAIGYRMTPEVMLFASESCFGTADAIRFDEKNLFLRIHDLKTGKTVSHMEQLLTYAAIFCVEYDYRPHEIQIELRIYQNDRVDVLVPDAHVVHAIMDKILNFSAVLLGRTMEDLL